MSKRQFFLICFLFAVMMNVVWTFNSYVDQLDAQLKNEILIRHGVLMLVLTFPCGWLASVFSSAFLMILGIEVIGVWDAIIITLVVTMAGYLQWFVVLPSLLQKLRQG